MVHEASQVVKMQGSPNLRQKDVRASPTLVPGGGLRQATEGVGSGSFGAAFSAPGHGESSVPRMVVVDSAGPAMSSRSLSGKPSSLSQDRRRKPRNKLMQSKGAAKEGRAVIDAHMAPRAIDEFDPNFDSSEEALLDEYVVHYDEDIMMQMDD